jgi:hypothetical protein
LQRRAPRCNSAYHVATPRTALQRRAPSQVRIWDIETLECARVLDASLGEVRARLL